MLSFKISNMNNNYYEWNSLHVFNSYECVCYDYIWDRSCSCILNRLIERFFILNINCNVGHRKIHRYKSSSFLVCGCYNMLLLLFSLLILLFMLTLFYILSLSPFIYSIKDYINNNTIDITIAYKYWFKKV